MNKKKGLLVDPTCESTQTYIRITVRKKVCQQTLLVSPPTRVHPDMQDLVSPPLRPCGLADLQDLVKIARPI